MGGLIIEPYAEGDLVNRDTQTPRQEAGPLYSVNLDPRLPQDFHREGPMSPLHLPTLLSHHSGF